MIYQYKNFKNFLIFLKKMYMVHIKEHDKTIFTKDIAKDDAIVLHCLPAHRCAEISSEILDKYSPYIFDESENRLHAQKAVLVKLIS